MTESTTDPRGPSLQARYAPTARCFGCGPTNEKGLRIESYEEGDEVVCTFTPRPEHEAWAGTVNGGIVGALFDCHCNWTAAWHLFQQVGGDELPSTVTAMFSVTLKRPTSSKEPLTMRARVVERDGPKATVEAEMTSGGEVTATCRGVFVSVQPGHPAYHRWR